MPESLDIESDERGRGLFRGRFGTERIAHETGSIVFFQPFRYWDRYLPRRTEDDQSFAGVHDHPESSYLELGTSARDAWWDSVRWEETYDDRAQGDRRQHTATHPFLDIVVVGRMSPLVDWDSENVVDLRSGSAQMTRNAPMTANSLYVFDDPEGVNRLRFESNSAEFRIYFVYRPNAYVGVDMPRTSGSGISGLDFEPLQNAWKMTPWLRNFSVRYINRTKALTNSHIGRGR